jgi:hypothetical protein
MQVKTMIGFRADPRERAKLETLAEVVGENMSEVLRQLVRNATIQRTEVIQTSTVFTLESEVQNG